MTLSADAEDGAAAPNSVRADRLTYRPVRVDEIETCAGIWRTSINDYIVRLGQEEMPDELGPITRLFRHLQSTDPDRFLVATDPDTGRVVAFAAAVVRGPIWYLAMLFVLPNLQGGGVGRRLLELVGPGDGVTSRGTATDSAQPISNALYASVGIVPRMPMLRLVGRLEDGEAMPPLPPGVVAIPFDELEAQELLAAELDTIDLATIGMVHPVDHAWVRAEGRIGFLFRGSDGTPVGYGYASPAGRVGPIAVRDPELLAPALGWLLANVEPRGAFAVWLPGAAGASVSSLLDAGFRIDAFPLLLCWDQPFADFSRYIAISPGLL